MGTNCGIPGARALTPPGSVESALMSRLRPFVRQSGDDMRSAWHLRERKLLDYLIVYIGSGGGVFTVGGETFPVGPGDLVWIPPDTLHEMRGTSRQMRCVYAHFDLLYDPARSHWDGCIPGGTLDLSQVGRWMHPPFEVEPIASWKGLFRLPNHARIAPLLGIIHRERSLSPTHGALLVSGLMSQLVAEMIRGVQAGGGGGPPSEQKARQAAARIMDDCTGRLDMKALATDLSLSPSHLRRSFRKVHGKSPRRIHVEAKMRRACELLVYSEKNVSEIADSLGFSTVHNFSRAFKNAMGVPPRAYKKGAAPHMAKG